MSRFYDHPAFVLGCCLLFAATLLVPLVYFGGRSDRAALERGPVLVAETPEGAKVYCVPLGDHQYRYIGVGKDGSVVNLTQTW